MNPKDEALKLAKNIKESDMTSEDRFTVAAILAAAGLGVLSYLAKNGQITQFRLIDLVHDLDQVTNELKAILRPH